MELNKKTLRKEMKSIRNQLSMDKKLNSDNNIFNRLINSNFYKNSSEIFIFVSFGSEVDTIKFINHALNEDKNIYVPKVIDKNLMIAVKLHTMKDLKEGYYGVLEPQKIDETLNPNDLDLVILPGLAFDRCGNRLGYGGGFYDRFLDKIDKSTTLLAVSYNFQILDSIPHNENDIKVEFILTDEELIDTRR